MGTNPTYGDDNMVSWAELSCELLFRGGECIGDVRQERDGRLRMGPGAGAWP